MDEPEEVQVLDDEAADAGAALDISLTGAALGPVVPADATATGVVALQKKVSYTTLKPRRNGAHAHSHHGHGHGGQVHSHAAADSAGDRAIGSTVASSTVTRVVGVAGDRPAEGQTPGQAYDDENMDYWDELMRPLYFVDDRHKANARPESSGDQLIQKWRMKERMKTVSVALILCLRIGVDPPDVVKTSPCARMECWIDPFKLPPEKALETIGDCLQKQYERWQPRARYKLSLDPT
eukprot:Opistho-2@33067